MERNRISRFACPSTAMAGSDAASSCHRRPTTVSGRRAEHPLPGRLYAVLLCRARRRGRECAVQSAEIIPIDTVSCGHLQPGFDPLGRVVGPAAPVSRTNARCRAGNSTTPCSSKTSAGRGLAAGPCMSGLAHRPVSAPLQRGQPGAGLLRLFVLDHQQPLETSLQGSQSAEKCGTATGAVPLSAAAATPGDCPILSPQNSPSAAVMPRSACERDSPTVSSETWSGRAGRADRPGSIVSLAAKKSARLQIPSRSR